MKKIRDFDLFFDDFDLFFGPISLGTAGRILTIWEAYAVTLSFECQEINRPILPETMPFTKLIDIRHSIACEDQI